MTSYVIRAILQTPTTENRSCRFVSLLFKQYLSVVLACFLSMKTNKQTLLDQIAADIVRDGICPDLAKTATHLVPGEGNPDADIVLIGEAPGKNEDLTGKPFVGAAGKLLTELLASAGLTREEVFITSIVKYRPPNNRDPKPKEKAESWPYMLRQLEVIQPRLVVTLGRHSMGYFVPGVTIGQAHGQLISGDKWDVMPVYHPAAALYGLPRSVVQDDFMKLKKVVEQLRKEPIKNATK